MGLPYLGRGWGGTLAFVRDLLFDEPGAPCHPGQDATILDLGSLCQPLVGPVGVQTDGVLLAVKATHGSQPICGVSHQGPPFESQGPCASLRSTFSAL